MTHTLTISYDDEILMAAGMSSSEFSLEAKFAIAAKLYGEGKLTAGQAAKLCDMGKVEFLHELPRRGYLASNLSVEDAQEELEFARGFPKRK